SSRRRRAGPAKRGIDRLRRFGSVLVCQRPVSSHGEDVAVRLVKQPKVPITAPIKPATIDTPSQIESKSCRARGWVHRHFHQLLAFQLAYSAINSAGGRRSGGNLMVAQRDAPVTAPEPQPPFAAEGD